MLTQKLTEQQAFDKVCKHLAQQKKRAAIYEKEDDNENCKYRMNDNQCNNQKLMCAIGCLIPDNEYKIEFEGKLIEEIKHNIPSLQHLFSLFLRNLQYVHDNSKNFEQLKKNLIDVASTNKLCVKNVDLITEWNYDV